MTNQELQIKVAKTMGYHVWWDIGDRENPLMWLSVLQEYVPIPHWPKNLPACMAPGGPWEWLKAQGFGIRLETGARCEVIYRNGNTLSGYGSICVEGAETESLAICHAVLAVAEKLKEQSDD